MHAFESRKSGHILISANHQDDDDRVTLTVRDNGVGIPPMHLSRVFDPFFTTKLGKGGSGLGLSIVFNLVQDVLGGTITVESIDGRGACFILSIPLAAPTSQPNLGA